MATGYDQKHGRPTASSSATLCTSATFIPAVKLSGNFNLSITGSFTGTVTVQRSFDGTNWANVESFTGNVERVANEPELDVRYRAGILTGEYTSGHAIIRLSQ